MNSDQAFTLIEECAATSSRTSKLELLAKHKDDETFAFVLKAAYDPFVTYGLKAPKATGKSDIVFYQNTGAIAGLLSSLSARDLTGNAAKAEVKRTLEWLSPKSAELLARMIGRDLKCGISNSTINEVFPGLIPQFSVMRAETYDSEREQSWPKIGEPKLDGFRTTCLIRRSENRALEVGFFSRNGKPFETIDHLKPDVLFAFSKFASSLDAEEQGFWFDGAMLDGEAMAGSFKDTSSAMKRAGAGGGASFNVFDMMPIGDFLKSGDCDIAFKHRRVFVDELTKHGRATIKKTPIYLIADAADADKFYDMMRAEKHEGIMLKEPDAPYSKKKSRNWQKRKPEETEDLYIVGVFNGDEGSKYENVLGGVVVDRAGVNVRVGGGFSDEERNALAADWAHDAKLLGIDPKVGFKPGYVVPLDKRDLGFKLINRMIEVEYHEVTPDGSLRHPRHVRFRDDKAGEEKLAA